MIESETLLSREYFDSNLSLPTLNCSKLCHKIDVLSGLKLTVRPGQVIGALCSPCPRQSAPCPFYN